MFVYHTHTAEHMCSPICWFTVKMLARSFPRIQCISAAWWAGIQLLWLWWLPLRICTGRKLASGAGVRN